MLIVLKLLGSIALLIYGMKVMSEALQKMAGPQLRHLLGAMTTNRFSGVATGALVTVAVQSSAATLAHAHPGHLDHHGREHRYDDERVDHVRRFLLQHGGRGVAGLSRGHYPDPAGQAPVHRRFPLRSQLPAVRLGNAQADGRGDGPRQQARCRRLLLEFQDQLRDHPAVPADRHDPDGDGAEFRGADGHHDGPVRHRSHLHLSRYRAGHG